MTLDDVDLDAAVAEVRAQIEASFARYRGLANISSIVFYWAGAEVAPYVPSDVMGKVYAGTRLLADSVGGFAPIPLTLLAAACEDDPSLADDDALVARYLAASLDIAQRAVALAVTSEAFAALSIARPFRIVAAPGHDEPKLVLLELPAA